MNASEHFHKSAPTSWKNFISLARWRDSDTGQSLVEFSLVLPIFLVLLFGLVGLWPGLLHVARSNQRRPRGSTRSCSAIGRGDYRHKDSRILLQ